MEEGAKKEREREKERLACSRCTTLDRTCYGHADFARCLWFSLRNEKTAWEVPSVKEMDDAVARRNIRHLGRPSCGVECNCDYLCCRKEARHESAARKLAGDAVAVSVF